MNKKLIEKIKNIVEDHLSNIDTNDLSYEEKNDHYLLGKWDLAQEINDLLIENKQGI